MYVETKQNNNKSTYNNNKHLRTHKLFEVPDTFFNYYVQNELHFFFVPRTVFFPRF